ncbi:hypothetical protein NG2371_03394 [Nocardia gamkensis]|nr:hypothetical protein [Nocardia gamkensis]
MHCAVALDTYSWRVVGRSLDSIQTAALVTNALGIAISDRSAESRKSVECLFGRCPNGLLTF